MTRSNMIVIDTNALVVLIVGIVDVNLFKTHKRTSIYDKSDYDDLLVIIEDFERLLILPNVWTELDNLLNNFSGTYKDEYIRVVKEMLMLTSEQYLSSESVCSMDCFYDLGLTDSLVLEISKGKEFLITGDSDLSDYAKANGVVVYDIVEEKSLKLLQKV